jgi:hypothetical protein
MLNTGYQSDFPLYRAEPRKDGSFAPVSFNVYGPKIIATRKEFKDQALESRCLTEHMDGKVRGGIPVNLTPAFWEEARFIRNKLLWWRLLNYHEVKPIDRVIDLHVQPRLAQILYPLSSVIKDDNVLIDLKTFMTEQDSRFKDDRLDTAEAKVLKAILEFYTPENGTSIAVQRITDRVNESIEKDRFHLSNQRVGRIISTVFELPRKRKVDGRYIMLNTKGAHEKLKYWAAYYGLEMLNE